MPDDLDRLLGSTRAHLLDDIDGLDLDRVGVRAATLRRRRHTVVASTAVAATTLVVTLWSLAGVGGSQALPGPGQPSPTPAPRETVTVATSESKDWNAGDITVTGGGVTDLPGDIADVQFVDGHAGYAVLTDCTSDAPACHHSLLFTADGGRNWAARDLPATVAATGPDGYVRVVPLGATSLVITGSGTWFSPDAGLSWAERPDPVGTDEEPVIPEGGKLVLALDPATRGPDCTGSPVDVRLPNGQRGRLSHQPPIGVCWVANTEATGGVWWVGGRSGRGRPAVASSRDGGRTWAVVEFPTVASAPGAWPKVASVGSRTYVMIVSGRADSTSLFTPIQIMAIHRSIDGGHTFAPFASFGLPGLAGDAVPLLDGRLLMASAGLSMGSASGTFFMDAPPDVVFVRGIRHTDVGWVAYDLWDKGEAAYSTDGRTWRRITIR